MKGLRLLVCGATGRMNAAILRLARMDSRIAGVSAVSSDWTRFRSQGVAVRPRAAFPELLAEADVAVDFSTPGAALKFARLAARARTPFVTGTTGLKPAQDAELKTISKKIPVFYAPNMSRGMNLMFHLSGLASEALADYDATLYEVHHRHKKDSPSGSAKRIARAVEDAVPGRKVTTVAHRAGEVIGEHFLTFTGPQERIEISHRAQDRDVFASGAIDAAVWVRKKRKGLFDFIDLMGLR